MKLFVYLIIVSIAMDVKDSNRDLRETNKILKNRLRSLTSDISNVGEEYIYNKEKLQAFLNQYEQSTDKEVKFTILEGIEYYCESILENFEIIGELEGVSIKALEEIVNKLNCYIQNHRSYLLSKELADRYNTLKVEIENKDRALNIIQQENSMLLGKLANSIGENDEHNAKLAQIQEKINKAENELKDSTNSYNLHVENLKSAMQSTVIDSISKERTNFKAIQESQDLVISSLQLQSEQLALKLEQISVENSEHQAKINIFLNNINRLERDLSAKSNQLLHSEGQYEEFRSRVEEDTRREIQNLREAEQ